MRRAADGRFIAAAMSLSRSIPLLFCLLTAGAAAQAASTVMTESAADVSAERARRNFARPVVLGPDDVQVFPRPPAGFDAVRPGVARGRIERFSYASGVTRTTRHANVYLPPGFSPGRKYPVLYLLHGIAGDEFEWLGYVRAAEILDNLHAEGTIEPMIVVFANGRALPDDRATKNPFTPENAAGFANFERDLFDFLIPAIDAGYPVLADREHRAVAGLSMGGGQALDFGLTHLGDFAWVGAFSPAPNTWPGARLVPDPAAARSGLRLLYLSCGNRDGLINVSQGVHAYLKAHAVPHVWNVDAGPHDRPTWEANLYWFARRLFRSAPASFPAAFSPDRMRALMAHPIVLGPDDRPAFPEPPAGFNARRAGIPRGVIERMDYWSTATGTTRHASVYLPPGYSAARRYPVLYLLHGAAGNEFEWIGYVLAPEILDNLCAAKAIRPMIVVFTNNRAVRDEEAYKHPFAPENIAGFARFEPDLLDCLIPAVDAKYSTLADAADRAIAGLSMGGGQAFQYGLAHPEAFAWIGGFSPAPPSVPLEDLVPAAPEARARVKLLYLSCGSQDHLIFTVQQTHAYLKAHGFPHVWTVDDSPHDRPTWERNLYWFAQRLFR